MKIGKRAIYKENKNATINLLISNQRNRKLLKDLLINEYEIISKTEDFDRYHLIIMDAKYYEANKKKVKELKNDEFSFTPVICLQGEGRNTTQNLFELVEDVIDLPVSKNLLLARVNNLIHSKKLWKKNKVLKDRYESIFNYINDMVFLIDDLGEENFQFKIREANEKLREKLNYQQGVIKGLSPEKFMPEEDIKELVEIIKNDGEAIFATEFHTSKGTVFPVEINARRVQIYKKDQILCAGRDITEQKKKEEKINYLLFHDELTGLYNRRFLEEEIKRLDTERQLPICIFIIDINGMKLVNDSYGHKTGDELLVKTADLLKNIFREEDILARWGGDEFSVFLPQTAETEAEKILERIKDKCEKTEEYKLPVSLGVGYAVKENKEQDISDVLNKADREMYKDKLIAQKSATNKIVKSLLSSLEAKSTETKSHTKRLEALAIKLGKKIGLSNNQLNNLSLLATLHDIGKVNVSEDILNKPGDLTDNEWEIVEEHPRIGYKIALSSVDFSSVADEILAHHERWDGEGYPNGLEKDEIPLLSRIISIVDAYDVMTNGRPYKEAMSKTEALNELKRCAGSQFDPNITEEFVDMMEKG